MLMWVSAVFFDVLASCSLDFSRLATWRPTVWFWLCDCLLTYTCKNPKAAILFWPWCLKRVGVSSLLSRATSEPEKLQLLTEMKPCQRAHLVHVVPWRPDEVLAVRLVPVSVVNHQIDRHLPLQTADVSMAEVIAELVNLEIKKAYKTSRQSHSVSPSGSMLTLISWLHIDQQLVVMTAADQWGQRWLRQAGCVLTFSSSSRWKRSTWIAWIIWRNRHFLIHDE